MGDPIATAFQLLQGGVQFFAGLAPGGFGLILIPLGALGLLSLLASRKPTYRG